ncbi:DUF2917 domain-containing protein [Aquabacterium commune]|uniref:DUF2917 domain-containing protein n=1 Tax=Aquabacterium commune TaxID=70586 RepID=UPI003BAE6764
MPPAALPRLSWSRLRVPRWPRWPRWPRVPTPSWHCLPSGGVLRLSLRQGEVLLVRRGRLWLTREGDAVDHLLEAGRGHVSTCAESVVVEAVGAQPCGFERHSVCAVAGSGVVSAAGRG